MKSLKNHISVIIPIFVMLFSFQFSFMLEKVVKKYEDILSNDYSIVVVALSSLDTDKIKKNIKDIKSIEEISTKKILSKLEGDFSKANLALLKATLPKFYSVKLKSFPSSSQMQKLSQRLMNFKKITKVETFSKTHDKLYRLLSVSKTLSKVFAFSVFAVSLLLVLKQMEVWTLEHQERMSVMGLFGAPFWMKSAVLYRLVFIDSMACAFLVATVYYYLLHSSEIVDFIQSIGLVIPEFNYLRDLLILMGISFAISFFSVTIVILRHKRE